MFTFYQVISNNIGTNLQTFYNVLNMMNLAGQTFKVKENNVNRIVGDIFARIFPSVSLIRASVALNTTEDV